MFNLPKLPTRHEALDRAAGPAQDHGSDRPLAGLTLAALGIVYGDIGTSPLYAMREALGDKGVLPLSEASVLGVLSLILWSLLTVVTLKYVIVILRAGNRGEGGVLALASLAHRTLAPHHRRGVLLLAMVGAALFYGDGIITPAISVLSAVEGLNVATPLFEPYVVPIALGILVALFLIQSRGTGRIGLLFGPVVCVWFAVLGALGLAQIVQQPQVLAALHPVHAIDLFASYRWAAFVTLGAVFLAVTGAEALYADMGHFGRLPIRIAWLGLVLPGLVLNYFGQGALLLSDPTTVANPFYLLAPGWALYPMVLLATAATVIASQAVISGAFSLSCQAVQLGYLPRLNIRHTSAQTIGQIYIPAVNWLLLAGVVLLVVGFRSSSNLAAAYGIAVSGTMAITTVLAGMVARQRWGWPTAIVVLVFGAFLAIDLTFLSANALKIAAGGWFPIVLAAALFLVMSTWRRGREVVFDRLYRRAPDVHAFLASTEAAAADARAGHGGLPHQQSRRRAARPAAQSQAQQGPARARRDAAGDHRGRAARRRCRARAGRALGANVHRVVLRYGFMESPDVPAALFCCQLGPPEPNMMDTSFFLSRETYVRSARPDLPPWRERLFIHLANGASTRPGSSSCRPIAWSRSAARSRSDASPRSRRRGSAQARDVAAPFPTFPLACLVGMLDRERRGGRRMTVAFRQLHPVFAGEVSGVDLRQPLEQGRGRGDRGRHGPICRAGVPRPAAHRRAAGGVQPQFRRDRARGEQQRRQARAAPAVGRARRHLEPRPRQPDLRA